MESRKRTRGPSWLTGMAVVALLCLSALAQQATQSKVLTNPMVNLPLQSDVSQPLRDMSRVTALTQTNLHPVLKPKAGKLTSGATGQAGQAAPSAGFQLAIGPTVSATIGLSFDGLDQSQSLTTGPDSHI